MKTAAFPTKIIQEKELCRNFSIHVIQQGQTSTESRCLIRENKIVLFLDGFELIHLICLPIELEYLSLGYLVTEGLILDKESISEIDTCPEKRTVKITTTASKKMDGKDFSIRSIASSGGRGIVSRKTYQTRHSPNTSDFSISVQTLEILLKKINTQDQLYQKTHGVHSSALCTSTDILYFNPDLGRHNTIDRIAGKCFWENIETSDKILICSGRFSTEMLSKLQTIGVPIAVTRATPTDHAVELAEQFGITILGARNPDKIIVYSHPYRIFSEG